MFFFTDRQITERSSTPPRPVAYSPARHPRPERGFREAFPAHKNKGHARGDRQENEDHVIFTDPHASHQIGAYVFRF